MKRNNSLATLFLAFAMLFVSSCKEIVNGTSMERSAGDLAEILVVTQNDEQWNGIIGDTINAYFGQFQYGLPQAESMNRVAHVNVGNFGDALMKHKSLLIVIIDPTLEKPVVEIGKDVWAAPQRVVKITAPDRASWCEAFNEKKETFKQLYDEVEHERIMTILRPSKQTREIQNIIKKKLGFEMTIPSGFFIARNEQHFMWLRKEYEKFSYGIFIYNRPYRDTIQFDRNNLISYRDNWLKQMVSGPADGSFMTTEKEHMPPMLTYISNFPMGDGFAAELRGMWCLAGDYMAGPFVSYTFHNEKTGDLVTLEGYVYYPNHKKRNDLLQLESILFSVKPGE